jgi:hypothetical protein
MEISTPSLPSSPDSGAPTGKSLYHKAANVAVVCLLAGWIFSILVTGETNKVGGVARIIGVVAPALLELAAVTAGAIALSGIRQHGREGLLVKGLAGVVVPILLVALAVPAFQKVKAASLHQRSVNIAAEISKAAPKMIDQITRLDGAEVGPDDVVTVNYTMISATAKDVDMKLWNEKVVPTIRHNVQQTPMARVIKEGTKMVYAFKDKTGVVFATVVFDPKDAP